MHRNGQLAPTRPAGGSPIARRVSLLVVGTVTVALTAIGPAHASTRAESPTKTDATAGVLQATDALATDDVWAAGYIQNDDITVSPLAEHWDGTAWSVTPVPIPNGRDRGQLQGIAGVSHKDVWAVGSSLLLADGSNRTLAEHWNGKKWKVVKTAEPEGVNSSYLQSVTVVSADDVWAVGYYFAAGNGGSIIEHWDGTAWTLVQDADPSDAFNASLQSVSAVSAKDVWATGLYFDPSGAGVTLAQHWNGKKWKRVATPNGEGSPDTEFHGVTAISANDVWATGYLTLTGSTYLSLVEHWDGTSWSIVDSPNPTGSQNTYLYGVDATSAKDVWAVGYYFASGGYHTLTEHWNGKKWKVVDSPDVAGAGTNSLFGVSAISKTDAWVSGYAYANADIPVMQHWDGSSWTIIPVA